MPSLRPPLKIAVTDPIISAFAEDLRRTEREHVWAFADATDPQTVRAAIDGADVIVCSRLTASDVASSAQSGVSSARLVHATGAGIDRIDLNQVPADAAVCNTGHHGSAIAEHVMMTALMLRRRVLAVDAEMRRGQWRTIATAPGTPYHRTLAGSTLGLIGFGEIGRSVALLAKAFDMRLVALRRHPDAGGPGAELLDAVYGESDLHRLLEESDVVVITAPLTESTRGLLDADAFTHMRRDAIIVNVARGAIIDEDDLYEALVSGRIGGAAIDVWWDAPTETEAPSVVQRFAALDRVVVTPHFSGHAREVFVARAADIARNIDLLDSGQPLERRVR